MVWHNLIRLLFCFEENSKSEFICCLYRFVAYNDLARDSSLILICLNLYFIKKILYTVSNLLGLWHIYDEPEPCNVNRIDRCKV